MSDVAGTESVPAGAPAEGAPGPSEQAAPTPAGGGHPAWDDLRSQIGETTFHLVKPHLQKFDTEAQARISRLNEDLDRYKGLGEFDSLQVGMSIAQQLEQDPIGFYNNYGGLLRERGLLDAEPTVGAEAEVDEDVDPRDARIQELEQMVQQVLGTQQEQSTQQQYETWNREWSSAFEAAKAQNPWLTDDDDALLRSMAARHITNDDAQIPDVFGKTLTDLSNYRNRTLSAPRANDSAPRLLSAGGGNPAAAQPEDISKLGRSKTVDLVTQMLKARSQE